MSQKSSDTMSSIDLWDDSSGLMMGGDNGKKMHPSSKFSARFMIDPQSLL